MGGASALYTFILENFWTKSGLKVLFGIPSIWANFARTHPSRGSGGLPYGRL